MGFTEETCTCPIREEVNPPLNVLSCLLIGGDMVVDRSNGGAEVNEAPKEYSSWGHNLASNANFPMTESSSFLVQVRLPQSLSSA